MLRATSLLVMLVITLGISGANGREKDDFCKEEQEKKRCKRVGTVHVGIYIVVDAAYETKLKENGHGCLPYLEVFINNVDAHFWELKCPDVLLTLVGVKTLTNFEENKFKKYKVFKNETTKKLDPAYTLGLFNRWVNNDTTFEEADVVYLLTSDEIRDFMVAYKLEMKAASYFLGPCANRRTALSKDDGKTFSGVPAMVQQIARLFGSRLG
uniref:Putative tick metalloprotease n=1 Tax=Ixodes ricinus TaxID=34613 RepID=V5H803_IXORI